MKQFFVLTLILITGAAVFMTGCTEDNPVSPQSAATTETAAADKGAEAVPDVAIAAFTADPPALLPGEVLSLSATVANLGDAAAGPFTVQILEKSTGFPLVSKTLPGLGIGGSASGTVPFTVPAKALADKVPPGLYTLVCVHDFLDTNPGNNWQEMQILVLDDNPVTESLGMYFDVTGTGDPLTSCEQVPFATPITVKILWMNPRWASTGGFECGWDLTGDDASFVTPFTVNFPVPGALDLGAKTPGEGIYNILVGFPVPHPTSPVTEMASMDVFFLEGAPGLPEVVYVTMRNAMPVSIPGVTTPIVMSADYLTLEPVDMPYAPGSPALQFNGAVCEVQFDKSGRIADVRNLFR